MTTQCCYLKDYDWLIKAFYEVDKEDAEVILSELYMIDCDPDAFLSFKDLFGEGVLNSGFTYTDNKLHVTLIVISKTTCADEFQDTFDHEKSHAAMHIAKELQIDVDDEEFQYLQGQIGKQLFKVAKKFLCDHCRLNFVNYGKVKIRF